MERLLHGIASSSSTWEDVGWWLQRDHSVLAPDLLGHGESAKPGGDYSLGAYANLLRDLLAVLGNERATVVGHSLGGGVVALQFAYQFPDRCERLILVSSSGLGLESIRSCVRLRARVPGLCFRCSAPSAYAARWGGPCSSSTASAFARDRISRRCGAGSYRSATPTRGAPSSIPRGVCSTCAASA